MIEANYLAERSVYPLSSDQKRLWILYQQNKANTAYNLVLTYHLNGAINVEVFRKSLNILFKRHFTLFSVFKNSNGEPYIEVVPHDVNVELIDFSYKPEDAREDEILAFASLDPSRFRRASITSA